MYGGIPTAWNFSLFPIYEGKARRRGSATCSSEYARVALSAAAEIFDAEESETDGGVETMRDRSSTSTVSRRLLQSQSTPAKTMMEIQRFLPDRWI
jgi:hypothetical protein